MGNGQRFLSTPARTARVNMEPTIVPDQGTGVEKREPQGSKPPKARRGALPPYETPGSGSEPGPDPLDGVVSGGQSPPSIF